MLTELAARCKARPANAMPIPGRFLRLRANSACCAIKPGETLVFVVALVSVS